MLRRTLLMGLGIVGLTQACASGDLSRKSAEPAVEKNTLLPPHCEALSLVWESQGQRIKDFEYEHAIAEQVKQKEYVGPDGRWWFDTDERRWSVTRPFGPGGFDSTHWFAVEYVVGDGKLTWTVDTETRKVTLIQQYS